VGRPGRVDDARQLQAAGRPIRLLEQAPAAAQQNRDQLQVELVEDLSRERLADQRAGVEGDVLLPRRLSGPRQGGVETLADEAEGRALADVVRARAVGEDEDRTRNGGPGPQAYSAVSPTRQFTQNYLTNLLAQ
jgi:hypothetical protein